MHIIEVENISKSYAIGKKESYGSLREEITQAVLAPFRHFFSNDVVQEKSSNADSILWALKDISFSISEGEVVGIIGRNGAGKSTLLKIFSRITDPTSGRVTIRGRVASLLEVGTGFHPELTGRENIFLNGALIGLSNSEIKSKFDEIVAFSEIEKFLDTPVKRYSSGMYVRLAFAVAAHLESEILIVDEVLAVGDAQFQKKCLGKMGEISRQGKTVLFVSHNMGAIQMFSSRGLLLQDGRLVQDSGISSVVSSYLAGDTDHKTKTTNIPTNYKEFKINSFCFLDHRIERGFNKTLYFLLDIFLERDHSNINIVIGIYNSLGSRILTSKCIVSSLYAGKRLINILIDDHRLPPGNYSVSLGISDIGGMIAFHEFLLHFSLSDAEVTDPLLVPYLSFHRDKIGVFINSRYQILAAQ